MANKHLAFWCVLLAGLVLDQASKIWIYTQLEYRVDEVVLIPGLLSFVHAQNPGAAFGLLESADYRFWVFGIFTVVATLVVLGLYRALRDDEVGIAAVLGLILSGALGNGIDRVHKQTVTDFVLVYIDAEPTRSWLINTFGTNEWPSFNVADSALLIGVALFFAHAVWADDADDPLQDTGGPSK